MSSGHYKERTPSHFQQIVKDNYHSTVSLWNSVLKYCYWHLMLFTYNMRTFYLYENQTFNHMFKDRFLHISCVLDTFNVLTVLPQYLQWDWMNNKDTADKISWLKTCILLFPNFPRDFDHSKYNLNSHPLSVTLAELFECFITLGELLNRGSC